MPPSLAATTLPASPSPVPLPQHRPKTALIAPTPPPTSKSPRALSALLHHSLAEAMHPVAARRPGESASLRITLLMDPPWSSPPPRTLRSNIEMKSHRSSHYPADSSSRGSPKTPSVCEIIRWNPFHASLYSALRLSSRHSKYCSSLHRAVVDHCRSPYKSSDQLRPSARVSPTPLSGVS